MSILSPPWRRAPWLAVAAAVLAIACGESCSGPSPAPSTPAPTGPADLAILNGRVIDPESGLDAVRHIAVRAGKIESVTEDVPAAARTVDAHGLVVSPGFIDLHVHGQDEENYRIKAMDGVTTALELEVGTGDVARWYADREGRALINYGVSASHIRARMTQFDDQGAFLPSGEGGRAVATDEQIEAIAARVRAGLDEGALGVGMGIQYTPGASRWEVLEMFRLAAATKAPVFVHNRAFGIREPGGSVEAFLEVIGAAAVTGAPLHIVHLNSMSLAATPQSLRLVDEARQRGIDVTTEAYPYGAGMTRIESALLDLYEGASDDQLHTLQWVTTGERLTRETFQRYRRQGGSVILHLNTPEMEALAITSPLTAIASDGQIEGGKGHPRQAGTYARVLGHYVRETGQLSLVEALRKMTVMPAQRLEARAPGFRNKGRIRVGADADLTVFDPQTVIDTATYEQPASFSKGFLHVIVNGVPVVSDGRLQDGVAPGRAQRAAVRTTPRASS
ncbi:MAG: amidohydrolase family protein [Vicinamibacterales bacterium]